MISCELNRDRNELITKLNEDKVGKRADTDIINSNISNISQTIEQEDHTF